MSEKEFDDVQKARHYNVHPSGVEAIEIVRHLSFNIGNAIKYCWRAGEKAGASRKQDLEKARWYVIDEIATFDANHWAVQRDWGWTRTADRVIGVDTRAFIARALAALTGTPVSIATSELLKVIESELGDAEKGKR